MVKAEVDRERLLKVDGAFLAQAAQQAAGFMITGGQHMLPVVDHTVHIAGK